MTPTPMIPSGTLFKPEFLRTVRRRDPFALGALFTPFALGSRFTPFALGLPFTLFSLFTRFHPAYRRTRIVRISYGVKSAVTMRPST